MPYPDPRKSGGNALSKYAGANSFTHPLELNYKGNIGDYARLRVCSMAEEDIAVIPAREMEIFNPKQKNFMKVLIPEPEDSNDMVGLFDHKQNPMEGCTQKFIYRIPVFVFESCKKGVVEPVNALRYMEFTQGLMNSLEDMRGFQDGAGAFNEETDRPDYDVFVRVVEGTGSIPKSYTFEPAMADPKNRKNNFMHENWSKTTEEVLEEMQVMDEVSAAWDEVVEALQTRMTLEEIEKKITPKEDNKDAGGGSAVGTRPGSRANEAAEAQEPEEKTAAPAGQQRRFGQGGTSAAGGGGGRRYGQN